MPSETQKSFFRDKGNISPTEEWLATNAEIQKVAAENPTVAPHSCAHCRDWELDVYHKSLNYVPQPGHGKAQRGFTSSHAREKAELGCPFFKRSLQMDPAILKRPSIQESQLDGAVAALCPIDTDSEQRLDITWEKDGKFIVSGAQYQVYLPHGVPLPPPHVVNHDADKARYPPPDWRLIDPSAAQSSPQFSPEFPDGQGLVGRLQVKSRQVLISTEGLYAIESASHLRHRRGADGKAVK